MRSHAVKIVQEIHKMSPEQWGFVVFVAIASFFVGIGMKKFYLKNINVSLKDKVKQLESENSKINLNQIKKGENK
jgi:hypothetical protein